MEKFLGGKKTKLKDLNTIGVYLYLTEMNLSFNHYNII
jgi:hypothetical protein